LFEQLNGAGALQRFSGNRELPTFRQSERGIPTECVAMALKVGTPGGRVPRCALFRLVVVPHPD
jgi:hypothetical protein